MLTSVSIVTGYKFFAELRRVSGTSKTVCANATAGSQVAVTPFLYSCSGIALCHIHDGHDALRDEPLQFLSMTVEFAGQVHPAARTAVGSSAILLDECTEPQYRSSARPCATHGTVPVALDSGSSAEYAPRSVEWPSWWTVPASAVHPWLDTDAQRKQPRSSPSPSVELECSDTAGNCSDTAGKCSDATGSIGCHCISCDAATAAAAATAADPWRGYQVW